MRHFELDVPWDFDFRATVRSHGWYMLAPFVVPDDLAVLECPLRLARSRVSRIAVRQPSGRGRAVEVELKAGAGSRGALSSRDRAYIEQRVRRSLRLDEDLSEFHALCRSAGPPYERAATGGFGRLLRSPSLFEDLVKVLATTNTAWSGTRAMIARLVAIAGTTAFPSPAEIAALGVEQLRRDGRWGYRAPYLAALAERVASGALDLDLWERWQGSTEELEREIGRLPGFGPYAVSQALMLLGRYDRIGVDSVFQSFVRRRYFPRARKSPSVQRMQAVYDSWGKWRFLAYWWEVWLDYTSPESLPEVESQSATTLSSSASRPTKK